MTVEVKVEVESDVQVRSEEEADRASRIDDQTRRNGLIS